MRFLSSAACCGPSAQCLDAWSVVCEADYVTFCSKIR